MLSSGLAGVLSTLCCRCCAVISVLPTDPKEAAGSFCAQYAHCAHFIVLAGGTADTFGFDHSARIDCLRELLTVEMNSQYLPIVRHSHCVSVLSTLCYHLCAVDAVLSSLCFPTDPKEAAGSFCAQYAHCAHYAHCVHFIVQLMPVAAADLWVWYS